MRNFIKNFAQDESGATAIEYGLIAALMAAIIITGIGLIGTNLGTKFSEIANKIGGA
ncbi:Flp/Fap pilin component [compost metagenome]